MTTTQNDTAILTDEQLDGVTGGGAWTTAWLTLPAGVRGALSDDPTGMVKTRGRFSPRGRLGIQEDFVCGSF